ncbi:hypothetical protein BASA83_002085 [Batrachochytrium salamandrivorans]|nr:hypothetical protein BASA83_002085 [Batrachochytrium salamandrivorans]
MRVACKTIPTENVEEYALELSPPPRCHTPNPLSRHKKLAAAQCMSPRPSGLYVPHEVAIHMYLSRPGNENIYVPRAIDYITLQDGFILIMEYINEEWVSLLSYLMERGRLGVSEARHIIRKVIDGMINLKQQGVLQEDLHVANVMYNKEADRIKLIDFGMTNELPGWREGKSSSLKRLDSSSSASEYKAK